MTHSFWDDLKRRRMEDPEFERAYVEASLRIQAIDEAVNGGGQPPYRQARRWMRRLLLQVAGCSLAAIAVSGLMMYPFHDHWWAGWVWAGLTVALGPGFMVVLDRWSRRRAVEAPGGMIR